MHPNKNELIGFIEELHHADMVRGLFMVFDNLLNGFSVSNIRRYVHDHHYLEDGEVKGKALLIKTVSKIASLSEGMFHLVKHEDSDDVWFIVGQIHTGITSFGYNLNDIVDVALSEFYNVDGEFGEREFGESFEEDFEYSGIFVTNWNRHITPSLEDPQRLQRVLIKISQTLQEHSDFLLEMADSYDFTGLAANDLPNDDYTDKNLEIVFKAFINRINLDILPLLEFEEDEKGCTQLIP